MRRTAVALTFLAATGVLAVPVGIVACHRTKPAPKPIPDQRAADELDDSLSVFGPRAKWGPTDDDHENVAHWWRQIPLCHLTVIDSPAKVALDVHRFRALGLDLMPWFDATVPTYHEEP